MLFLRWLKETYKVIQYINFSSCTRFQWVWAKNAGLDQHTDHNFISINGLSNITAAYLFFLYDTQFFTISFIWLHVFYTVEQGSATYGPRAGSSPTSKTIRPQTLSSIRMARLVVLHFYESALRATSCIAYLCGTTYEKRHSASRALYAQPLPESLH